MTVVEAARYLEVSRYTVYDLCRAGRLAYHRIGRGRGALRIDVADLQEYKRRVRVEVKDDSRGEPARRHGSAARRKYRGPAAKKDHGI